MVKKKKGLEIQHSQDRLEYTDKSWRPEETPVKDPKQKLVRKPLKEGDNTNKWYMHNPAPVRENDTHKLLWDFNIKTDHLIPARRPDLKIINKKKRICKIVDFAVPADHRINLKECAKKDKYLDLARELKKLWNMKVTIVPIVIGAFGAITKGLLKGLKDLEVGGRERLSKRQHC